MKTNFKKQKTKPKKKQPNNIGLFMIEFKKFM